MKTNGLLQCKQPMCLLVLKKNYQTKTLTPILHTSASNNYMALARKKTPSFLLHTQPASAILEQQFFKLTI